jgi:hypothetical protein
MANHAWVKTRKKIDPEQITELINRLIKDKFKNTLTVEYSEDGFADHVWTIKCPQINESRICWLEGEKHFEMRHGGGGNFIWWVDHSIINEVALQFGGKISDEGTDKKIAPKENLYPTFKDYLDVVWRHLGGYTVAIMLKLEYIPKEFK